MAPHRELETFWSYALGKHWHDIMFEPPERAREVLKEQGLNYFLIDVGGALPFWEVIQFSPLLSVRNVGTYLQVAWNEGDLYLLTWPGPGTSPIPESFLTRYSELSQKGKLQPLYERVRLIYEMNRDKPYPVWRDPALPPVRGWQ
jgi:hypothetical protein